MKLRTFFGILIIGGIGGVIAGNVVLPYLVRANFLGSAFILDKFTAKPQIVTQIQEKTVYVPRSEYFSDAIIAAKNTVVAVQSFKKQKQATEGNGLVITRDGLIVAVKSAIAQDADNYQIVLNGRANSAKLVYKNDASPLIMLSVSGQTFEVAKLEQNLPELGRELLVFSRKIETNKDEPTIADTFVSQVNEAKGFKIFGNFGSEFNGSALFNGEGLVLGLIDQNHQNNSVVASSEINSFFESYLAQNK